MPDYTPGPWIGSERGHDVDAIVNQDGTPVCYLFLDQILPGDLSLILAAPDLLRACQEFLSSITRDEWLDAVDKMRDAVNKSTGEFE